MLRALDFDRSVKLNRSVCSVFLDFSKKEGKNGKHKYI